VKTDTAVSEKSLQTMHTDIWMDALQNVL